MFTDIIKKSYQWLFPKCCIVCGTETEEGSTFCYECFAKISFIGGSHCFKCGKLLDMSFGENENMLCESCNKEKKFFDEGRSLFVYNNVSKKILSKIKNYECDYTGMECAKLLIRRYRNFFHDIDIIIPVPSHWTKILRNGYNPPSLIARSISKVLSKSKIFNDRILKKYIKTEYQKNKNKRERVKNVKNAFICTMSDLVKNKIVLLVDDTITTGSTLNECSKIMKHSGAKYVKFATIASTDMPYIRNR